MVLTMKPAIMARIYLPAHYKLHRFIERMIDEKMRGVYYRNGAIFPQNIVDYPFTNDMPYGEWSWRPLNGQHWVDAPEL